MFFYINSCNLSNKIDFRFLVYMCVKRRYIEKGKDILNNGDAPDLIGCG